MAANEGRAEILAGLREWAAARIPCMCCTFGNHDFPCTCGGSGCCHPACRKEEE